MVFMLYRVYDAKDRLLYVGASSNFPRRIREHEETQSWWSDAVTVKLERVDTWEHLLQMEETAIVVERPIHNVVHGRPTYGPRPQRRPKGTGSIFRRKDGLWVARIDLPPVDGKRKYKYKSSKDRKVVRQWLDYMREEVDQDRREKEDRERCQFAHPDHGRCAYKEGHRLKYHLCGGQKIIEAAE